VRRQGVGVERGAHQVAFVLQADVLDAEAERAADGARPEVAAIGAATVDAGTADDHGVVLPRRGRVLRPGRSHHLREHGGVAGAVFDLHERYALEDFMAEHAIAEDTLTPTGRGNAEKTGARGPQA